MGNLGAPEILLILLLVFVFFGAKKIPEIAQGMGKGIREFRKAAKEIQSDQDEEHVLTAPKTTREETAPCFNCKAPVPINTKFCPSCGQSQEPQKCPKCSTVNPSGSKFCSNCGEKF
jgi:TatA/E family protein of Tat protein translocase